MKLVLFLFISFIFQVVDTGFLQAQSKTGLSIGDSLPDRIFLNRIVEDRIELVPLTKFKGKVVILDFWSRGCTNCIAMFPKIERLNTLYKEKLIILPVTKESQQTFKDIQKKSQIIKEANLLFSIEDTTLHSLFPHKYVPYYIWIDQEGKFIGASNAALISESIINKVLAGNSQTIDSAMKATNLFGHQQQSKVENIVKKNVLDTRELSGKKYRSTLRKIDTLEFLATGIVESGKKNENEMALTGFRYQGIPLLKLIRIAYGYGEKDIVVKSYKKGSFFPPSGDYQFRNWIKHNAYSYEIDCGDAATFSNYHSAFIRNDLRDYLGLLGEIKYTYRSCYVLKAISMLKMDRIEQKAITPIVEITKEGIFIRNANMPIFLKTLSDCINRNKDQDLPFIDETGYQGYVDMHFTWRKHSDIKELNDALKKYGLHLQQERRNLETLVLSCK